MNLRLHSSYSNIESTITNKVTSRGTAMLETTIHVKANIKIKAITESAITSITFTMFTTTTSTTTSTAPSTATTSTTAIKRTATIIHNTKIMTTNGQTDQH